MATSEGRSRNFKRGGPTAYPGQFEMKEMNKKGEGGGRGPDPLDTPPPPPIFP